MAQRSYDEYFLTQAGAGISNVYAGSRHMRGHGISATFAGTTRMQRGTGIADFLKGLLRTLFPVVRSAGRAVVNEAARAGLNVLSDVTSGETTLRDSVRNRAAETGNVLKEKLERKTKQLQAGEGYKYKHSLVKPQLRRTVRPVKTKTPARRGRKARATLPRDIFSTH